MAAKLDATALKQALQSLPDWTHDAARGAILRSFRFTDFNQAFAFMTRVALYAERHDHHPEWSIVYHRVDLLLITQDAGGLTKRDINLARFADGASAQT